MFRKYPLLCIVGYIILGVKYIYSISLYNKGGNTSIIAYQLYYSTFRPSIPNRPISKTFISASDSAASYDNESTIDPLSIDQVKKQSDELYEQINACSNEAKKEYIISLYKKELESLGISTDCDIKTLTEKLALQRVLNQHSIQNDDAITPNVLSKPNFVKRSAPKKNNTLDPFNNNMPFSNSLFDSLFGGSMIDTGADTSGDHDSIDNIFKQLFSGFNDIQFSNSLNTDNANGENMQDIFEELFGKSNKPQSLGFKYSDNTEKPVETKEKDSYIETNPELLNLQDSAKAKGYDELCEVLNKAFQDQELRNVVLSAIKDGASKSLKQADARGKYLISRLVDAGLLQA